MALHKQTNTKRSTRSLDFRPQNTYARALESFLDSSTKGDFATGKIAMSSEKVDYSRRSIMLKVAAEAPAFRASETDDVENCSWPSKHAFFGNFPAFSDDGRPWEDDDQFIDVMALVVLDDFPAELCRPKRPVFNRDTSCSPIIDSQRHPSHERRSRQ